MLLALPAPYFTCPLHTERTASGRSRIVPGYVSHDEYVALWRDSARLDYAPSVWVQGIRIDTQQGERALYEVSKYGVKPASLLGIEPDALREIARQVAGVRGIAIGGALRRFLREPDGADDLLSNAIVTTVARWDDRPRRYCLEDAATGEVLNSGLATTPHARAQCASTTSKYPQSRKRQGGNNTTAICASSITSSARATATARDFSARREAM
jgi:hypothetical protein